MGGRINRQNTMAESRWRLQLLRVDGTVEREQVFSHEGTAFQAFDALAPSSPKRLQLRAAGKSRFVTIEGESLHRLERTV